MPAGRPSKYEPRFCQMLIEHCKKGGTFESFGAIVHCGISTLKRWEEEHDEFRAARKEGMPYLIEYYSNMGKMLATGQLRRVKSETPVIVKDREGNEVALKDDKGEIVYKRTYEPAVGNAAAWIFLTKNILGWRDRKDIEHSGPDGGPINFANMSDEELKKKLADLQEKAKKFL